MLYQSLVINGDWLLVNSQLGKVRSGAWDAAGR